MLGTNDIKTGKDGRHEAEDLINKVRNLKIAQHNFIVELPPINRRGKEVERRIFNSTLHRQNTSHEYNVIRMLREIEDAPIESALQDDLHLTKKNSRGMAAHIESVVTKIIEKGRKEKKPQSTTPKQRRIPEDELAQRQRKNETMREEKGDVPCRYFRQGRCHRGDRCFFKHEQGGERERNEEKGHRERSRERREEARPSHRRENSKGYARSRSPSGDKRRVVVDTRRYIKPVTHE